MASKTVEIVVESVDNASGNIVGISKSIDGLGTTAASVVTGGLALAATGILAIGTAAIGAAVAVVSVSSDIDTAVDMMAAQMGIAKEEAIGFEGVMKGIFANNFGESFDDIGLAITTITQNLGDMPDEALQGIAEDAFALRDAFGLEVNESIMAAKNLMAEFGLTGEEAMDFIASGMQNGLNASGDFVDSISEYGNLFGDAGFSADEFYSIMQSGAETGVLGTDKIADAVKEMGIILSEGSDDTKAAFDQIGLSFDDIAGFVVAGDEAWSDYFPNIIDGLNSIEDPIERSKAQVAIFGTMAEDLGVSFTEGLSSAVTSLEDMSGATEALNQQYDNWPSMWEGVKRNALLALEPLGDALLGIANDIMPKVQVVFDTVFPIVQNVIETISSAINTFTTGLEEGMTPLDAFIAAISEFIPQELLNTIIDFKDDVLPGLIEKIIEIKDVVIAFSEPIIDWIAQNVELKDILIIVAGIIGAVVIGALVTLISAIAPVIAAFAAAVLVVATLRKAWETDFAGIRDFVANIWSAIRTAFDAFKLLFQGDFEGFTTKISEAWQTGWNAIVEFVGNLWTIIKPYLVTFWKAISDWFKSVDWKALGLTILNALITGVQNGLVKLWGIIQPAATKIGADIKDAVITALSKFIADVKTTLEGWRNAFFSWRDGIKWEELGYTVTKKVLTALAEFIIDVKTTLDKWGAAFVNWFEEFSWEDTYPPVRDGIKEGLAEFAEDVVSTLDDWGRAFVLWFAEYDWKSLADSIANGLVVGLKNAIAVGGKLLEAVKSLAAGVLRAFKEAFGATSPARVMIPLGESIGEGVAEGIGQGTKYVTSAIADMADTVEAEATIKFANALQAVSAAIAPAIIGIQMVMGFVSETDWNSMHVSIVKFGNFLEAFVNVFATAMNNIDANSAGYATAMAAEFAQAVMDVSDSVLAAIEAFKVLDGVEIPDVSGKLIILVAQLELLVSKMSEAAQLISVDALEHAEIFASAAGALLGIIEDAIVALIAMADYVAVVGLKESAEAFSSDLIEALNNIIDALILANVASQGSVEWAGKIAESVTAIVALIQPAVDGLIALGEYVIISGLKVSAEAFKIDLLYALNYIIDALILAQVISQGSIEWAGKIATSVSSIFEMIQIAIDGIIALSSYVTTSGLETAAEAFKADLLIALDKIIEALILAQVASQGSLEWAGKVASDLRGLFDVITPAIDAIVALSEYEAMDNLATSIEVFVADFMFVLDKLVSLFTISADVAGVVVVAVQIANDILLLGEAAKTIIDEIVSLFDLVDVMLARMEEFATTTVPGGIRDILAKIIAVMREVVPQAYDAGYDFGLAWVDGIRAAMATIGAVIAPPGGEGGGGGVGGAVAAGGLTTNVNMGGITFNTEINNQMTEDEFTFKVVEVLRSLI